MRIFRVNSYEKQNKAATQRLNASYVMMGCGVLMLRLFLLPFPRIASKHET